MTTTRSHALTIGDTKSMGRTVLSNVRAPVTRASNHIPIHPLSATCNNHVLFMLHPLITYLCLLYVPFSHVHLYYATNNPILNRLDLQVPAIVADQRGPVRFFRTQST